MSINLLELAAQAMAPGVVDQISKKLGMDNGTARNAITSALPIIISAMSKNAGSKRGADSLFKAVQTKHNGSILDNLGGLISSPEQGEGNGILRHLLGNKRPMVERNVGQSTGANPMQISKVLQILAPIVLAVIGRNLVQKKQMNSGGIADVLKNTTDQLQRKAPKEVSIIEKVLDSNQDGRMFDDVANIGMKLLGGFLSRR